MNVEKIIVDLLYKYDCVIIPEFGGFIAQRKSAVFHPMDYTFDPPKKVVGFNSDLVHSDGLLAHEIAKKNNISYSEAIDAINQTVNDWKKIISSGKVLEIESLGSFKIANSNIEFMPNKNLNFSFDSFGMYPVKGQYILRTNKEENQVKEQKSSSWTSYVAAIGFALLIGGSGFFANDNIIQPQLSSVLPLLNTNTITTEPKKEIKPVAPVVDINTIETSTPKVEETNSVTEEPVQEVKEIVSEEIKPTENKIVENKVSENKPEVATQSDSEEIDLSIKPYRVIGGSFKLYSKAMQHRAYLKRKGFDRAVIIGKVGKFYMVAYDTFDNATDAKNYKRELERKGLDVFMIP